MWLTRSGLLKYALESFLYVLLSSVVDGSDSLVCDRHNMYVCMHASSFARTYAYIYLIVALLPELITVLNLIWFDFTLV
jgi:hypothetical protein